jgi:N-acetylneuraminic acid mutarotase
VSPSRRSYWIGVAAIAASLLAAPLSAASAESVGAWASTTAYPSALNGVSCTTWSGSIYCIGGVGGGGSSHSQVYHATLGASGIGSWSPATAYPTPIDSASCVNSTTGVYCVGGEDGSTVLNDVYFAPASSGGLGAWASRPSYPNSLAAVSCVTYSGYIYCVGGFDQNGNEVSSTYYASISSGLTSWTGTTQYPQAVDSTACVVVAGYIYCVAGEIENASSQNNPISNVYYAPLSSSGIGQWSSTLSYPIALAAPACAAFASYVYCVGGFDSNQYSSKDTFYGPVSSSGVGSWSNATPYPIPIDTSTCVVDQGHIYCVSGTSDSSSGKSIVGSSYYAAISGTTTTSTTPEFPATAALPIVLALGLVAVVLLGRTDWKAPSRRT